MRDDESATAEIASSIPYVEPGSVVDFRKVSKLRGLAFFVEVDRFLGLEDRVLGDDTL